MTQEKVDGVREQDSAEASRKLLCAKLKEEIVRCESEFEEAKSDAFEGTILEGKLGMLRAQYKCLEKGEEPEALLIRLRERKQEL